MGVNVVPEGAFVEPTPHEEMDTLAQMQHVVAAMVGKRLMYRELVAGNRASSRWTGLGGKSDNTIAGTGRWSGGLPAFPRHWGKG